MQQGQQLLTVLVVEDEPLLQGLAEDALADGGFQVEIAASAEDAMELLRGKTSYCALVSDIHLGGKLDGWEVAKVAREMDPNFPIVYMTGAAADEWPSKGVPKSILLNKPFAPAQLVTAVSQLLNTAAPLTAPN